MMAYNVEDYIEEAIVELQKESLVNWELIVVEDFSSDNTFNVVTDIAREDDRITLVKNVSKGVVVGINYSYNLTKGEIIKCIDSDDILTQGFFDQYKNMLKYDVYCHNMRLI